MKMTMIYLLFFGIVFVLGIGTGLFAYKVVLIQRIRANELTPTQAALITRVPMRLILIAPPFDVQTMGDDITIILDRHGRKHYFMPDGSYSWSHVEGEPYL